MLYFPFRFPSFDEIELPTLTWHEWQALMEVCQRNMIDREFKFDLLKLDSFGWITLGPIPEQGLLIAAPTKDGQAILKAYRLQMHDDEFWAGIFWQEWVRNNPMIENYPATRIDGSPL